MVISAILVCSVTAFSPSLPCFIKRKTHVHVRLPVPTNRESGHIQGKQSEVENEQSKHLTGTLNNIEA